MTVLGARAVDDQESVIAPGSVAGTTSGRWRIEPLFDAGPGPDLRLVRGGRLPAELAALYGSHLAISLHLDRATVIANFVSTLDGIVALDRMGATGGRQISGDFEADRFVMGLLRATADAVLVGAGTVRASHRRDWTPGAVHPPSAVAYGRWRRQLGLAPAPTLVVVTATGDIAQGKGWFAGRDQAVLVVTTDRGAARLRVLEPGDRVEVVALGGDGRVAVDVLLDLLRRRGFRLVLSEAGPTLFGELLAARAVDEVFLTLAPQVAGRAEQSPRLGLVEGTAFTSATTPWARLRSVLRSADHLFLRYELPTGPRQIGARP